MEKNFPQNWDKNFNSSAKGGYKNEEFPARPWAQQLDKESCLEIQDKILKTKDDINFEEIVHTETPFAAVVESKSLWLSGLDMAQILHNFCILFPGYKNH